MSGRTSSISSARMGRTSSSGIAIGVCGLSRPAAHHHKADDTADDYQNQYASNDRGKKISLRPLGRAVLGPAGLGNGLGRRRVVLALGLRRHELERIVLRRYDTD